MQHQPTSQAIQPVPALPKLALPIYSALKLIIEPGQVFEIRALGCKARIGSRPHIRRGYFDSSHIAEAAVEAAKLTERKDRQGWGADGVYLTLNPLNTDLLSRCANRVEMQTERGNATDDEHILSRRWLLIDVDPKRISGVSSSDTELEASRLIGQRIAKSLTADHAFPSPAIISNSGNGWHILYRVDLPNDDSSTTLVKSFLNALDYLFGDLTTGVDTKVFNASRICKIPGTFARKGDHTETRPHRRSAVIRFSESPAIVTPDQLEAVARLLPIDHAGRGARPRSVGPGFSRAAQNHQDYRRRETTGALTVFERARKYAASTDPAISGQGGHSVAFRLACELVRGFSLPTRETLEILTEWNERCDPPWTEAELVHKIEQAQKHADGDPGYLLARNWNGQERLSPEAIAAAEITPFGDDPQSGPLDDLLADLDLDALADPSATDGEPARSSASPAVPPTIPAPHLPLIPPPSPLILDGIIKAEDDPYRLAEIFLDLHTHDSPEGPIHKIRYYRESFHRWDGKHWRALSETELAAAVTETTESEFQRQNLESLRFVQPNKPAPVAKKTTCGLVTNVINAIKAATILPDQIDQPAWVINRHIADPSRVRSLISVQNGILDVAAAIDDQSAFPPPSSPSAAALRQHSPALFSPVVLPCDFNPSAECPRWQEFLSTNFQDDEDLIAILQQWFGYCLGTSQSHQKFLLMEGEGRNGKSVICAALTALLGPPNVSHVPLEFFGEKHALISTLGKLANIASEIGEIDRVAEGVLKAFTAGDRMPFEPKFKSIIEAIPTAKLVFATNNRPRFSDRSAGLWRRMILLPLHYQVPEDRVVLGMDQPSFWLESGELPGILNWAIAGAAALRRQGCFSSSDASASALSDYRMEANPARQFLAESYIANPEWYVTASAVYQSYVAWCKSQGCSPLNAANFGREVRRAFPQVDRRRHRIEGVFTWVYHGVQCTEAAESTLEAFE